MSRSPTIPDQTPVIEALRFPSSSQVDKGEVYRQMKADREAPLSDADRERLDSYVDGILGALEAGDFDREVAMDTVKDILDAALRGDHGHIRFRLHEADRYGAEALAEDLDSVGRRGPSEAHERKEAA